MEKTTMKKKFRNNKEIQQYNSKQIEAYKNSFSTDSYKEVALSAIRLEESIHLKAQPKLDGEVKKYKTNHKQVTAPLLVRKSEDGYVLLAGWKNYQLAKALHQDMVKVLILDFEDRVSLLKALGCHAPFKVCKMTDLVVSHVFADTKVSPEKLLAIKEYEYKHHAQAKPVTVNKKMQIIDGYSQYVYNRNMEKEYCEVKMLR